MKLEKLDPTGLKKGMFVLIETIDNCVEIGIVRPSGPNKEQRIFILTDCEYQDLPPVFDESWIPFLPPYKPDVLPTTYPLYAIEDAVVESLMKEQKEYLEKEKENTETLYNNTKERSDEKLITFKDARNYAKNMFFAFCQLEETIKSLRS